MKLTNKILSVILAVSALLTSIPIVAAANDVTKSPINENAPKTLEELRTADIAETAKLPRFDSRDYGIVNTVRDQGTSDLCWAYASVSVAETAIMKKGIADNVSLSPEKLGYFRHLRGADPLGNTAGEQTAQSGNWYNTSGDPIYAASVWSQWCGPVYTDSKADIKTVYAQTPYHLITAVNIGDAKDRDAIKRAIVKYGAVTFSYNNKRECDYYNAKNETSVSAYPHACTIIGWDDSVPADKFQPGGASQNGGWIIKNSYVSKPYFYLSYDCGSSSVYTFDFADSGEYDYNYFYDADAQDFGLKVNGSNYTANVFEAKKGTNSETEYIKAVNIAVKGKGVTCNASIYTDLQKVQDITDITNTNPENGTFCASKSAYFEHAGYYTIELDEPVKIDKGSYFSVVIKVSNSANNAAVCLVNNTGRTYMNKDYWFKGKYAARIKAFTVVVPAVTPTSSPTVTPTPMPMPTVTPTPTPTVEPTSSPTAAPTPSPTATPTASPTVKPTATPTATPTASPTVKPTATPTATPTASPTVTPTTKPTVSPTVMPTATPTASPTVKPTATPTATPTASPTVTPTVTPTASPTPSPIPEPRDRIEFAEQSNGTFLANIIFEKTVPPEQEDIVLYIAYYRDGQLMRVETPQLVNMSALFDIDEKLKGCEIKAFVWDKMMKPLMEAQKI